MSQKKYLFTSQTNEIYNILEDHEFKPEEFQLRHDRFTFNIEHKQTGFYFSLIDNQVLKYNFEYSPGEDYVLTVSNKTEAWIEIHNHLNDWAKALQCETEQPDLWANLAEGTESLHFASDADASNTSFSSDELDFIKQQLDEIKDFVFTNHELSEEHQKFVETKLKYLEECAKKSEHGRIDWLNIAIGVLMSIIVGISFNPEQAKTLMNIAGKALSPLFGGSIPLLP